jgi:hypothetical protein
MARSELLALTLVAASGCAEVIGADFDVVPLPATSGVEVLVPHHYPFDVGVDATHVYWTAASEDIAARGIWRVPKGGGEVEQIAGGTFPNRLVVTDTLVYWSDSGDEMIAGSIWRWAKSAAAPPEPVAEGIRGALGVAVLDHWLWFSSNEPSMTGEGQLIYRVDLDVMPFAPEPYAVLPGVLTFVAVHGPALWALSTDAVFVMSASENDSLPLAPEPIALEAPNGLALVDHNLAFVGQIRGAGSGVHAVRSDGTSTLRAPDQGDVGAIAIDGIEQVYWAAFSAGQLARTRVDVGPVEAIAPDQPFINGVAIDDERVFFTRFTAIERGGAIAFIAKPR